MTRTVFYTAVAAALLFGAGVASAQTTTPKSTTDTPAASTKTDTTSKADTTKADASKMTLTEAQAKTWIDKPVYSSDNKQIGEVASVKRGADNVVTEMQADIGGMMGMGETRVKIMPNQFKLQGDRVVLSLTQEQAKTLPKVES